MLEISITNLIIVLGVAYILGIVSGIFGMIKCVKKELDNWED